MKITPDSSLFSALSNLPGPNEARRRPPVESQAAFADRIGKSPADPGRAEKEARDAIVRQALREAAQRQASLRQTSLRQSQAPTSPAAARSADPAATFATGTADSAGAVKREAPFADAKPNFVRLGQFLDIQV